MEDPRIVQLKKRIADLLIRSSFPEAPFHSENTLEWVLRLKPDADPALRIAALAHDIEHYDEKIRVQSSGYTEYERFKEAHAINSAEVLSGFMEELGFDPDFIADVTRLVAHHESGGDKREEILKNADTLSFFQVSLPLYYDRHGADITRRRLVWGFRKLPTELRRTVLDMEYPDPRLRKMVRETLGE